MPTTTHSPTLSPTLSPTALPSLLPTPRPTISPLPSPEPTALPTPTPTLEPTKEPTPLPTGSNQDFLRALSTLYGTGGFDDMWDMSFNWMSSQYPCGYYPTEAADKAWYGLTCGDGFLERSQLKNCTHNLPTWPACDWSSIGKSAARDAAR